jgi:hypothetical protein
MANRRIVETLGAFEVNSLRWALDRWAPLTGSGNYSKATDISTESEARCALTLQLVEERDLEGNTEYTIIFS